MNKQDVLKAVIDKYGDEAQSRQAMEECGELIVAINKTLRYPTRISRLCLIEEMADVSIMITQLKLMHCISNDELKTVIDDKIEKLKDLI